MQTSALCLLKAYKQWTTSSSNTQTMVSKRQGSLEKWWKPDLGQEMYPVNLEHLAIPEGKEAIKVLGSCEGDLAINPNKLPRSTNGLKYIVLVKNPWFIIIILKSYFWKTEGITLLKTFHPSFLTKGTWGQPNSQWEVSLPQGNAVHLWRRNRNRMLPFWRS